MFANNKRSSLFCHSVNFEQKRLTRLTQRPNVLKLITAAIYVIFQKARAFIPGKSFQPSHSFVYMSTNLPKRGATEKVLHSVKFWPQSQTLDLAGKA
jgi:hypothetical protein